MPRPRQRRTMAVFVKASRRTSLGSRVQNIRRCQIALLEPQPAHGSATPSSMERGCRQHRQSTGWVASGGEVIDSGAGGDSCSACRRRCQWRASSSTPTPPRTSTLPAMMEAGGRARKSELSPGKRRSAGVHKQMAAIRAGHRRDMWLSRRPIANHSARAQLGKAITSRPGQLPSCEGMAGVQKKSANAPATTAVRARLCKLLSSGMRALPKRRRDGRSSAPQRGQCRVPSAGFSRGAPQRRHRVF